MLLSAAPVSNNQRKWMPEVGLTIASLAFITTAIVWRERKWKGERKQNVHNSSRFLPLTTPPRRYLTVHMVRVTPSQNCQRMCLPGTTLTPLQETHVLAEHQKHLGNRKIMISDSKDECYCSIIWDPEISLQARMAHMRSMDGLGEWPWWRLHLTSSSTYPRKARSPEYALC